MASDDIMQPIAGQSQPDEAPPLPGNVRAVLRVGNEFFLRSLDSMAALAGDDLIKALIYNAMWSANVRPITDSAQNLQFGGLDEIPPDELRVPVSVTAIASALRIPYETTRRYVHGLIAEGSCIRVGRKGFIVPASVLARQEQRDSIRDSFPSLLRFVGDLKRVGFDFAPFRGRLPATVPMPPTGEPLPNSRAILRVLMDAVMRGVGEIGNMHDNDFLYALIFTAIWTANVHHITASPTNLKYGALYDLPPDDLRRPVTVHAIASSLRIPYETVRRYVTRMVKNGSAVRKSGRGVIVPRTRLAITAGFDSVRDSYRHIERGVAELHRAGFDFSSY